MDIYYILYFSLYTCRRTNDDFDDDDDDGEGDIDDFNALFLLYTRMMMKKTHYYTIALSGCVIIFWGTFFLYYM